MRKCNRKNTAFWTISLGGVPIQAWRAAVWTELAFGHLCVTDSSICRTKCCVLLTNPQPCLGQPNQHSTIFKDACCMESVFALSSSAPLFGVMSFCLLVTCVGQSIYTCTCACSLFGHPGREWRCWLSQPTSLRVGSCVHLWVIPTSVACWRH